MGKFLWRIFFVKVFVVFLWKYFWNFLWKYLWNFCESIFGIFCESICGMETLNMCVEATVHWFQMDSNLPKVGSFQILSSYSECPQWLIFYTQQLPFQKLFIVGCQTKSNSALCHHQHHGMDMIGNGYHGISTVSSVYHPLWALWI